MERFLDLWDRDSKDLEFEEFQEPLDSHMDQEEVEGIHLTLGQDNLGDLDMLALGTLEDSKDEVGIGDSEADKLSEDSSMALEGMDEVLVVADSIEAEEAQGNAE